MKKLFFAAVPILFMVFFLTDCSEKVQSPVEPAGNGLAASLDKKGPIVHKVVGSGHAKYEGKIIATAMHAIEYSDGTIEGEYEANMQAAFQIKWHGKVLSLKVYTDVPGYGTVAIIGGQIQNSNDPSIIGLYDCYVVVYNSKEPDLNNGSVPFIGTIETAEYFWNADPLDIINGFTLPSGSSWPGADLYPSQMGNYQVY